MTVPALQRLTVRVCVCVVALVALTRAGPAISSLADRAARPEPSPGDAAVAGGRAAQVNVAFVEWVRAHVPAGSAYWIATPAVRDSAAFNQWLTYRMLPRRESSGPATADALIWFGDRRRFGRAPRAWRTYRYANAGGSGVAVRSGL